MVAVDNAVRTILSKHEIPGCAIAVAVNNRLVYARGFGFADRETQEPMQPDALFRIASVSKPVTALALLRLVEQGKVSLDDRPFANALRNLVLPTGRTKIAAYDQVTVRQLLQHLTGFPPATTEDILRPTNLGNVTRAYNVPNPPTMAQALGYSLTVAPRDPIGTVHRYGNINIGAVGRLIETVAGKPYERFVQEDVLANFGITRMSLGKALRAERKVGEVRHHMPVGTALVDSIYPSGGRVELPYGGFPLETYEGAGAWLGSPVDLVRLFSRFNQNNFLSSATVAEMVRRPAAPVSQTGSTWYGLGTNVFDRGNGRYSIYHDGTLSGTRTYLRRTFGGTGIDITYAFFFNMRKTEEDDFLDEAFGLIDAAIFSGGNTNASFPAQDLYPLYFAADRPQVTAAGVVSAASFRGGAVAPGQIVTLFGQNLGGAALTTAAVENGRLATRLNETRVLFDGTPAPLVYTSAQQVSAIVPYGVAGKATTQMTVEYRGFASANVEVAVTRASPAVFTADSSGTGAAAAIRYREARVATIFATGEGLLSPLPQDGALSLTQPLPAPQLPVRVLLAGREVPVLYAGAAPGLTAGLLQINIQIPEDLAEAENLPLVVEVGGVRSPEVRL
ncbi:serine hydrolase [Nostoc sp. NIES-2111]